MTKRRSVPKHSKPSVKRALSPHVAKISPHRLPPAYPRAHLFKVLNAARQHPLIWVCAPAGAGKTTLAVTYTRARRAPTLWYQLDKSDADIATFFYYFSRAVANLVRGARLPDFTSEHYGSLMAFTRSYFEAVSMILPAKTVVVLDGYHALPERAPLHSMLSMVVDQLPTGCTIIILSRDEPPACYSGVQARSQLFLLSADALRLTHEESLAITKLQLGGDVGLDQAESLYRRSGGWAVGLTLLIEQYRRGLISPADVEHSHHALFDYLAAEIFLQMPSRTRALLLKVALLPYVSIDMANRLSGDDSSAGILADLYRRLYLVQRLDGSRVIYQFHPLLQEFLQGELRRRFSGEEVRSLQRATAQALLDIGDTDRAMDLLLEARDWETVCAVVHHYAPKLVEQGRNETLAQWLYALPAEEREQRPWMQYWLGSGEILRDPPKAAARFGDSYVGLKKSGDFVGAGLSLAGAIDSIFLGSGDQSAHDDWITRFEQLLDCGVQFPSVDIEGRIWASVMFAVMWRQPAHPRLREWLTRAEDVWAQVRDMNVRLRLGSDLLYIVGMGQHAKAIWYATTLERQLSARVPAAPVNIIYFRMLYAYAETFLGHTESAREIVRLARVHAEKSGTRVLDAISLGPAIYASLLDSDVLAAGNDLSQMGKWLASMPENLDLGHYEILLGWRALLEQNFPAARAHTEQAVRIIARFGAVYPECLAHFALANVLAAQGEHDAANAEIHKARLPEAAAFGAWMAYQCDLLCAELSFSREQNENGLRWLRQAFERGRECGFGQPLCFSRERFARLCVWALENGIESDYVHNQVRLRDLQLPASDRTLTERECEILKLVAKGLSRADVARMLEISPHTVASHIAAVYRKLNISSRSEATLEAIRLRLVKS